MKPTVFIFDLDGTLTKQESLPLIADYFGIKHDIRGMTARTMLGELPFGESFRQRVDILKDLPVSKIAKLIAKAEVHALLANFIRKHSDRCVIATSNLSCWVSELLSGFGCASYTSEATVKDDRVAELTKILPKEQVVRLYQSKGCMVVFIGDGHNDKEAMSVADISIAVGLSSTPPQSVIDAATYFIKDEEALLQKLCSYL